MTRILVTGGAGYIGSILVERLLERGYAVTVLDDLRYAQQSLLHCAVQPRFRFVRGDVRDESLMGRLLADHDVSIPLAAVVGQKACDRHPCDAEEINLRSIELLNRLRPKDHRVVWPGTISGYGAPDGGALCTEESPLSPLSHYARTKVSAERELLRHPLSVSLRLATVFGPSPRLRLDLLVNDWVYRAVTDGFLVVYEKDFRRQFLHVEDAAAAFIHVLAHFDAMKGHVYNVGLSDANLSKGALAARIKEHVPDLRIHFAEVGSDPDRRSCIVSCAKLARAGFVAARSIDEGIRQLVNAYGMLGTPSGRNA